MGVRVNIGSFRHFASLRCLQKHRQGVPLGNASQRERQYKDGECRNDCGTQSEEQENSTNANDSDDSTPSKKGPCCTTEEKVISLEIVEALET